MEILEEILPGCFLIKPFQFEDCRGLFVKTYHAKQFSSLGINFNIEEEFYSVSHKNILRGMHFQTPPDDLDKLVYCIGGKITDVVLDLRPRRSYGKYSSIELSSENNLMLFIPKGIAHGFIARTNNAIVSYKTSAVHKSTSDFGIRWDSFGYDWGIDEPIISTRDSEFPDFKKFNSPF